jgi:hypothetical protein
MTQERQTGVAVVLLTNAERGGVGFHHGRKIDVGPDLGSWVENGVLCFLLPGKRIGYLGPNSWRWEDEDKTPMQKWEEELDGAREVSANRGRPPSGS